MRLIVSTARVLKRPPYKPFIVAWPRPPVDDEVSVTLHECEIASKLGIVAAVLDRSPYKASIVVWLRSPIHD